MSSAKITLFTFARWMNQNNDDLFKNFSVPAGIERDTLIDNILLRGGEFEVVYSDPHFMQYSIGTWSRKWYRTMSKWIEALSLNYNPLENYDRYENIQDTSNKTNKMDRTLDHADTVTINTQDLLTHDTQELVTHDTEDSTLINTQDLRTLNTQNKETKDLEDINLRNLKDEEVRDYRDLKTMEGDTVNLRNLKDKETRDLKDKETPQTTDTTSYDHTTTTEQLVSAYDSSTYQPSQKTINSDGVEVGGDLTHNKVELKKTGTDTFDHTGTDIFEHFGSEQVNNVSTDDTTYTGTDTTNRTGSENITHTGTDTTENTGTDTLNKTGTETTGHTGTETTGHTGTIKDAGGEDAFNDHIAHIHGNIGVTTSQQMLQAELDIDRWNIYEHITDLFLNEFVIPIYT